MVAALQAEADMQAQALISAYSLDEGLAASLREELQKRIAAQIVFEQTEMAALIEQAKSQLTPEGNVKGEVDLFPKLQELNSRMPLNEVQVATWLETLVPEQAIPEGRQRWEELRTLRYQKQLVVEEAIGHDSALKSDLSNGVAQSSKSLAPHDDLPLPNDPVNDRYYAEIKVRDVSGEVIVAPGRKGSPVNDSPMPGELTKAERLRQAQIEAAEREGRRKPGSAGLVSPSHEMTGTPSHESIVVEQPPAPQVTVQVAPTTPAGRAAPAAPAAKEVAFAQAPPLDDWDKYVQERAKQVGFDEAQMTRAQAVLKDMKRRANQYRMSRSDQFAVAALKTDAKAREAMMKELNKPIDAMFDELKQRIDSLMTLEQRQKAAAGKK
ncbi:MAG: hypothetical protein HBSAPP02_20940 [Phycisphaerae bacterium]|nr:MAG: hypothetical protein HBSAPP02_20940 [Phycisphaerae bacterium]